MQGAGVSGVYFFCLVGAIGAAVLPCSSSTSSSLLLAILLLQSLTLITLGCQFVIKVNNNK